jgi:23S rRNA pseudouridine2605 synthase
MDASDEQAQTLAQPAAHGAPPAASASSKPSRPTVSPAPDAIAFADVVSGRFDADEADIEVVPGKRVLAPQAESPKLHKVLAQAGLGSRLEMEQLIMEGRISVNNEPAHIGQRIQFGDQVKVNGKPINCVPQARRGGRHA